MLLRVFLFVIASLSVIACSSPRKGHDFPPDSDIETIILMGTNDIHGALVPDTLKTQENDPSAEMEYQTGGIATLAGYVNILRKEYGNRLLWLDAGDQFQGTIESNFEKGKSMVSFFNLASLQGSAIGNHEFDFGPEHEGSNDPLGAIKARLSEALYPYLAANILDRETGKPAAFPNTLPSKIYQAGRLKVGVIGLSTLDTPKTTRPAYVRGLIFENLKDATLRESRTLRANGADVIVIAAHVGLKCLPGRSPAGYAIRKVDDPQGECGSHDEMVEFLRSLPGGTVDAVISGHSHQLVHHWISGVPVIQGGALGRYFNLIHLNYDFKTRKVIHDRTRIEGPVPVCPKIFSRQNDCNGARPAPKKGRGSLVEPRFRGEEVEPDSRVEEMLEPILEKTAKIKAEVIATAARRIETDRYAESAMGNLVADALRAATGADFALTNNGGIRAGFESGKIIYGDVFRTLPFDNGVVVLNVSGKELLTFLRVALSGSRGFASLSGLKVRLIDRQYDAPSSDLDGNHRIEAFETNRIIEVLTEEGEEIEPKHLYKLATVDFLVIGGDDVGKFMQQVPTERQVHHDFLLREAVMQHLRKLASTGPVNSAEQPLITPGKPRLVLEKAPSKKQKKKKKPRTTVVKRRRASK